MTKLIKEPEDLNKDGVIDEKDYEIQAAQKKKSEGWLDEILSSPFSLLSPIYNYFKDDVKKVGAGAYSNISRGGINAYNYLFDSKKETKENIEKVYGKILESALGSDYVDTEIRNNGDEVTIVKRPEGFVGTIAREMGGFGVALKGVDKLNDARKFFTKTKNSHKSFSKKRPIVAGTVKAEAAIQVAFDPMHENLADVLLMSFYDEDDERGLIAKYLLEPMSTKEGESETSRRLKMLTEGLAFTGILAAPTVARQTVKTFDDIKNKGDKYVRAWLDKLGVRVNQENEVVSVAKIKRQQLKDREQVVGKGDFKGLDETPISNNRYLRGFQSFFNKTFKPKGNKTVAMHEKYLKTLNAKEKYMATVTHTTQRLQDSIDKVIGTSGFQNIFKFNNVDDIAKRDDLIEQINKVLFDNNLAGQTPAAKKKAFAELLKTLPKDVRQSVLEMRKIQDSLSKLMIKSDLTTKAQKEIYKENLGEYIRTSYKFYEQPGYRPSKAIEKEALEFIENNIRTTNKRKLSEVEIKQEARAELDKILNKDNPNGASQFQSGLEKFSKINKGLFNEKKELATPIKNLLGEVDKPIDKFIASTTKLVNALEDAKFHDEMFEQGAGIYFYKKPTGVFTEQIPQGFGKLSGQYTTKELKAYYSQKKRFFLDDEGFLGKSFRTLALLKGISQSSKTVLSHATHVKNIAGGVQMSLANGTNPFDIKRITETINTLRRKDAKGQKFYEELSELGIVNKGVVASDLRGLADDIAKSGSNNPLLWILNNKGSKFAQNVYIAEDDFFKINMYLGELQHLQKVNKARPKNTQLSEKSLKEEAAKSVRDTLPNYDLVPEYLKDLRRSPFFGRFFSFMSESVRISYNSVVRSIKEIRQGQRLIDEGAEEAGKLVAERGTRRLAAFSTVAGLGATAAEKTSQTLMGIDKEEAEALRQVGFPDYMQNSKVLFGAGPSGDPMVTNLSSWDAYDFPKKGLEPIINMALSNPDDGTPNYSEDSFGPKLLKYIWNEMASPFVGESLVQGVLNDYFLRNGVKSDGKLMSMPSTARNLARATGNEEYALQKLNKDLDGINFYFDSDNMSILAANLFEQLVPGTITSTTRWYSNLGKEQTSFDQDVYETNETWKLLTGFGGTPLNKEYLENNFKYKISDYNKTKNNYLTQIRGVALNPDNSSEVIVNKYLDLNRDFYNVSAKAHDLSEAARYIGLDPVILTKDAGVFDKDFRLNLEYGRSFLPLTISRNLVNDLYEQRPLEARKILQVLTDVQYKLDSLPIFIDKDVYKNKNKNLDNEIDETFDRLKLKTGGLVPNVKEDPADRIDPFTGEPYQAKDTLDEQMEKLF